VSNDHAKKALARPESSQVATPAAQNSVRDRKESPRPESSQASATAPNEATETENNVTENHVETHVQNGKENVPKDGDKTE
jgi:hypothetical protein